MFDNLEIQGKFVMANKIDEKKTIIRLLVF